MGDETGFHRLLLACVSGLAFAACSDSIQPQGGSATTSSGAGGAPGAGGDAPNGGGGHTAIGGREPAHSYDCSPPAGDPPESLMLVEVAAGLTEPVALVAAPGDEGHLYVVEKRGTIRVLDGGTLLEEPFLDLSATTFNVGEAGLLSLAFHPQYPENGRFFVYFVEELETGQGAQLAEFRRSDTDPLKADPEMVGQEPLLDSLQNTIHLGGTIMFSLQNGYLHLTMGERGYGPWAQDLSLLVGKVLRIDVSTTPYGIPPDNLQGGRPEIWDIGLRNPWRASIDPCTGDMFIGDVGENTREEINIEPYGSEPRNYGWPMMEGLACHPAESACDTIGLTLPAIDYDHAPEPDFFFVIVGGYVYRGGALPALRGTYLHANNGGRLFALQHRGGIVTAAAEIPLTLDGVPYLGQVVSMGQDLDGELYFVQIDEGKVFRIAATEE